MDIQSLADFRLGVRLSEGRPPESVEQGKMGDFRDLPLLPEAPSVVHYHVVSHNIW